MTARLPSPALDSGQHQLSPAELACAVRALAGTLEVQGTRVLATLLDNSPAWVVADLAARDAGVVHVPLPLFFSREQLMHALAAAGVDTLLTVPALAAQGFPAPAHGCDVAGTSLVWLRLPASPVPLPAGTAKITFTSGTTGTPKGVCLAADALDRIRDGLVEAMAPVGIERHLCALPFAVLLENVAGLAAPLAAGATCVTLPLQQVGLAGSSSFDAARLHEAMVRHEPHSTILLPQMLRAWTAYLQATGQRAPRSLKFVAVGGAAVGAGLLLDARAQGIPAHEGYGLSEGASVQTLNLPGADRPGSAGRPLPHARVRVADDGELEIAGSLFAGYLGRTDPVPHWWPTGDLGRMDADGYVHLLGRKKNVLITAFGRNVSPEWVETALCSDAAVAQAVVFGDGEPSLSAVLWPTGVQVDDLQLHAAVAAANARLPDYARVVRWTRGRAPFDTASGLATGNGRPRRGPIWQLHADVLSPAPCPTQESR